MVRAKVDARVSHAAKLLHVEQFGMFHVEQFELDSVAPRRAICTSPIDPHRCQADLWQAPRMLRPAVAWNYEFVCIG